jgi:hypothetical protein
MSDTTPGGWPDAARPGYPKDPEQIRYHWVRLSGGGIHSAYWNCYEWNLGRDYLRPCEAAHEWHYLGPCHTPAEVAAQVEAARREEREAIACDLDCGCPDETKAATLEALRGGFNSAKRWKACGHSECSAIEAAAIRARGDA